MNTQNYLFSQSQNISQTTSNSVIFHDQPRSLQEQSENYPFFQQNKNNTNKFHTRNQPHYYITNYFPSDDGENYNQIIKDFNQAKDLVPTVLTNKIFSNHTHEMIKYDNLEITQQLTTIVFNNENQLIHDHNNQVSCITKFQCHIIYNNMK